MRTSALLRRTACTAMAAVCLHAPWVHAGLIGPEAALAAGPASSAEDDRTRVRQFVERATVQDRLRLMGVGGLDASRRVDAMTQEEVHALAQRIDTLPAGGALTDRDIILVLLVALVLVVL